VRRALLAIEQAADRAAIDADPLADTPYGVRQQRLDRARGLLRHGDQVLSGAEREAAIGMGRLRMAPSGAVGCGDRETLCVRCTEAMPSFAHESGRGAPQLFSRSRQAIGPACYFQRAGRATGPPKDPHPDGASGQATWSCGRPAGHVRRPRVDRCTREECFYLPFRAFLEGSPLRPVPFFDP